MFLSRQVSSPRRAVVCPPSLIPGPPRRNTLLARAVFPIGHRQRVYLVVGGVPGHRLVEDLHRC